MIAKPIKTARFSILVVNLVYSGQPTQSLKFLPGDMSYLKRGIDHCPIGLIAKYR